MSETDAKFHAIEVTTPGRALLPFVTCDECRAGKDWAGVAVNVVEPWLGPDEQSPDQVPAELARVYVVEVPAGFTGAGADVRLDFVRHPDIPGVAGHLSVTMFSADEATHLGNLLIAAGEKARKLDADA